MKKKTISANQPDKTETTRKHRASQGKNIIVTDHMPDWMQQYLLSTGINREFDPSTLSPTQFSALESAERLYHTERAGLIRVTFDPETDMEPKAELTDHGRTILQSSISDDRTPSRSESEGCLW
jgi:hypothetical protein